MENARTFTNRLADLLRNERSALADFLVALSVFDRQRLWVDLGHASLFYFLHRELGLSKGAAYYRKVAAELIQKFPEIVEPLRDGRLCITTVVELSKVLTRENRNEVLPRFFELSKSGAREVVAEIRPAAAPRRDVMTGGRAPDAVALPLTSASPDLGQGSVHPANRNDPHPAAPPESAGRGADRHSVLVHPANQLRAADPGHAVARPANPPPPGGSRVTPAPAVEPPPAAQLAPSRPASVDPLTAESSRLHVTVSRRFLKKLEAARAALSHAHPGAGIEEILEAGLDLVLERHARRRGLVKKPRRDPPPAKPEHVPAHVKRAVWERDGGVCQWPLEGGGICGSTHRVELDHVQARGLGGPPTIENARNLCRFHNDLAARQAYGDEWMDRFTERGLRRSGRVADASRSARGVEAAETRHECWTE